jgi:hypothetical protein
MSAIQGFWSLHKRGIAGSYHKVSKNYLSLYLTNSRSDTIIAMMPIFSARCFRACSSPPTPTVRMEPLGKSLEMSSGGVDFNQLIKILVSRKA